MERVSYTQMCIVKIVPINKLLAISYELRVADDGFEMPAR